MLFIICNGFFLYAYFVQHKCLFLQDNPMRFFFRIFVPVLRPEVPKTVAKQETVLPTPQKPVSPIKNETKENEDPENKPKVKDTKPTEKECVKMEKKEPVPEPIKEEPKKPEKTVKFAETVTEKHIKVEKQEEKLEEPKTYDNCVYDYTESDKDELRAFAEKRDREWAMQKHEDEYHVSKKRKKNKHSKNEFMHKKRKLHAEITSNTEILSKSEDSLKLKVKLSVPNGHKHKHRNNFEQPGPQKTQELSTKEKLLQMRQVRHKKIETSEDKNPKKSNSEVPPVPQYKIVPLNDKQESTEKAEKVEENKPEEIKTEKTIPEMVSGKTLRSDFSCKTTLAKDLCNKMVSVNIERCKDISENNQRKQEIPAKLSKPENKNGENKSIIKSNEPPQQKQELKPDPKIEQTKAELKPVIEKMEEKFNSIQSSPHEFVTKNFTVSKIEMGVKRKAEDKQLTIDKRPSLEITLINPPVQRPQSVSSPQTKPSLLPHKQEPAKLNKPNRPPPPTIPLVRIQKSLNLKSGISIIPKIPEKCDNIGALDLSAKPNKMEMKLQDFRPKCASPRINCASPRPNCASPRPNCASPRIGCASPRPNCASPRPINTPIRPNSASPKMANHVVSPKTPIRSLSDQKIKVEKSSVSPNISNLQMLSESAVQIRDSMTRNTASTPPIPNLIKKSPQLKIPVPQNPGMKSPPYVGQKQNFIPKNINMIPKTQPVPSKVPNFLQKGPNSLIHKTLQKLPKLNEINKSQFRGMNIAQIRNARPAQNQTIRNIPNPSLLVRQQNQNRINLMSTPNAAAETKDVAKNNSLSSKQNTIDKDEVKKEITDIKTQIPALKTIESVGLNNNIK